jgi:hypothetical protein
MDRLRLQLTLRAGGQAHTVAGGDVLDFDVALHSHGVEGTVTFAVADDQSYGGRQKDQLLAGFLEPDLIELELTISAVHSDAGGEARPAPLTVRGLVCERTLVERDYAATRQDGVLERVYQVRFGDPARVLWSQHQPCQLHVGKSLRQVLDAHKGGLVELDYEWDDELASVRPQLFLGLGASEPPTSFYDFVVWFADTRNGCFGYDHARHRYHLRAAKPAPGATVHLFRTEVEASTLRWPAVPRHGIAVLNSYSESPAQKAGQQPRATAGVRQERLVRTPIAGDVDAAVTLAGARVKVRGPELELACSRLPSQPFVPGDLVVLDADHGFAPKGLLARQPFRAVSVRLTGRAPEDADAGHLAPDRVYALRLDAVLERQEETFVHLPPYLPPRYPALVEGRVVSEAEGDQSWQAFKDAASGDRYRIEIPLWTEDEKPVQVVAPFEPGSSPGQLYLPAYKKQRVLVALELERASIARFLDWRPGARLADGGQGDQILLGTSPTSNTAISHAYQDSQPVFRMLRTNAKDMALVEMKEGALLIQVKENP